jgi:4-hydroxybenzoate polyprenyltransferase
MKVDSSAFFHYGMFISRPFLVLKAMRPHQWVKNGFVLIPVLFSRKAFEADAVLDILLAVVAFSLAAGGTYLFNDIKDIEADRRHPEKRMRPLAAGLISIPFAGGACIVVMALSILAAYALSLEFLCLLTLYLLIQLFYTFRLKRVPILDVFCISAGFFLRVMGGAIAIEVEVSHWLIICTTMISMFLALGKRRGEVDLLGEEMSANHREVLGKYDRYLLDQMLNIITACTLLSYMLYCFSPETIAFFGTGKLVFSFPCVLYGVLRYLYVVHKKKIGGSPEKILFSDLPLLVSIILWGMMCTFIIYGVV